MCLAAAAAVVLPAGQSMAASPEQAELAERLLQTGQQLANVSPAAAAALADASERMFDNDPRLLRLAADLRLALGQRDPAIKLLGTLRQLDPTDQIAQIQSIDLLVSRMETADEKANYLIRLVDNAAVSAEVRSHAALILAGVQSQRGQDDASQAALDQAIRLNPLNPKALQWRLEDRMRSGTAQQRTRAMVDLLLANPLQQTVLSRLAEEHLRAGATNAALDFYGRLFNQLNLSNAPPSTDDAINYCIALIQAGRVDDTGPIVQTVMRNDPNSPRVQYLNVLVAQQSGDANYFNSQVAIARGALIKNLMTLQTQFDQSAPPVDDKSKLLLPDTVVATSLLKSLKKAEMTDAYVNALSDLAWLDVYFMGQPTFDPVIDAINALADPKGVVANRINGFTALAEGRLDLAEPKLTAAAPNDPLSELGLLSLQIKQGKDKGPIYAAGMKLLTRFPVDVYSLMIRQSLQGAGTLNYKSADADAIVAESNRLPRRWLDFSRTVQQSYLLDVDAQQASIVIGQPLLAKITLQNTGDRPLLIGPGGVIDQRVPMDITVRGLTEQSFPAAAIARLTGKVVLQPNQATGAVVRLDSPEVESFISANPQAGLSIFVSAIVNPVPRDSLVVPGPGGMRAQSRSVIDRQPMAYTLPDVRQKIAAAMASNDPVQRLHAVMQLVAAGAQLAATADEQHQFSIDAFALVKKAADSDPSPTVRAVARQQLAMQQDDAGLATAVQAMLASPDIETRLIGVVMTINRPAADRKAWLAPLAKDADPAVQKFAAAVAVIPDAPTSQPTTAPGPATAPAQQNGMMPTGVPQSAEDVAKQSSRPLPK